MAPKKSRSTADRLEETVNDIFKRSQHQKNVKRCVKDFLKIFKEMHSTPKIDDFRALFLRKIKQVLISERNSPYTKKTLDFIATSFKEMIVYEEEFEDERLHKVAAEEARNDQLNESMDSSLSSIVDDDLGASAFDLDKTLPNYKYLSPISTVDLLLKNHLVEFTVCIDPNIRYNTLSLLKKTLDNFNEMDEDTFKKLRLHMNERTFDKEKTIRALACLCLEKLQNSGKDDNVMKALKFHMLRDPDATVRICALKTVEVNTETVKALFNATRDECNSIRKTAYSKIAQQSSIVNFTPKDRLTLLMNGLNERVDHVKEVILTQLIPNWIKGLDNGIVGFLDNLDIKRNLPLAQQFLTTYFTHLKKTAVGINDISQFHQMVFEFKENNLDEHKLFTKSPLTEESAFLWLNLCDFCHKWNITYKVETKETNAETDEENVGFEVVDLIDKILPDVPIYTMFVEKFAQKVKEDMCQNEESGYIPEQFIFKQLLKIGKLYKIKDDAQWNSILTTFKRIIQDDDYFEIFENYIEHIISIFGNYFGTDHEKFLDLIFDLINAINEIDEEEQNKKVEVHKARLIELHGEKSNATLDENSEEVGRIDSEIQKVEKEKQAILDSLPTARMETDDKVLLRILQIFYGFFQAGKLKREINRLPTMINKLILPGLQSSDSKIRTLCVKNLGLYCMPSINLINFFIKVFIEIVDGQQFGETRVEALQFIFDFLCYHGFKFIKFSSNDFRNTDLHKSSSASSQIDDDTENLLGFCEDDNFAYVFSELIEKQLMERPMLESRENPQKNVSEYVKLQLFDVATKGTCKIMNLGRFYSDKLLARLIVIHLTFEKIDPQLRQFIEGFMLDYAKTFPMYLQKQFSVKSAYVDAYEPSMEVLIDDFLEEKDREKWADKLIDFFNIVVMEDQLPNLMLKAAAVLNNEEFRDVWYSNFKLIEKADLKTFDIDQLDALEEQLLTYKENNAVPDQPKRGRGVRKTGDKKSDTALKLLSKIKDRKAYLDKLQQQQMPQTSEEPEGGGGGGGGEDDDDQATTITEQPPPTADEEEEDAMSNA